MAEHPKPAAPQYHVPRRVLVGQPDAPTQVQLADLRHLPAYVLLGDPGGGKTAALLHEAANTPHGHYVRAIDVQHLEELPVEVVLFVDGLDEVRAGLTDAYEPLTALKQRLRDLRIGRFRIACRAADWIGQVDQHAFSTLLPSGELTIAQLLPMAESELAPLIVEFGEPDPQAFLAQVHQRHLHGLLHNPMSLKLLVAATREGWPGNGKQALYQQACGQLVRETNPDHKARTFKRRPRFDALINATGEICALLLLSGTTAINLHAEPTSSDVIELDALPDHDPSAAALQHAALGTRLFATRVGRTDTFEPVHRTVAEYLAAQHLSGLLDANPGLPALRLSALFGPGGQVVTSLRGLNAWLAVLNTTHRRRFIEADPLGVALYGDASTFTTDDKQFVLERLAAEAQKTPHFRMGHWQQAPDAALASADMADYFRAMITSKSRTAEHLALVEWVFDLLEAAGQLIGLDSEVQAVVRNLGLPDDVRSAALSAWLASKPSAETARTLLADLRSLTPPPAPMIGRVARHFYPGALSLAEALTYLPPPSRDDPEAWHYSWGRHVAKRTPDEELERAIEALLIREQLPEVGSAMPGEDGSPDLLARLVRLRGETASPQELCRWLSVGFDKVCRHVRSNWYGTSALAEIQGWLRDHPAIYKSLAALILKDVPDDDQSRALNCLWALPSNLLDAPAPDDFARWALDQTVDTPNAAVAEWAFAKAMNALVHQSTFKGLSIEFVDDWCEKVAVRHPDVALWRQRAFVTPWSEVEARRESHQGRLKRQSNFEAAQASWIDRVSREATALHLGQASDGLMNELAMIWVGRFHDVQGETGEQRLQEFLKRDTALFNAARAGLTRAHWRASLPTVEAILILENQGQRHTIADACLLGADLEFAQDANIHLTWPDDLASRLLAFLFTRGTGGNPNWFDALIDSRPDCVAQVYLAYLLGRMNAGQSYVYLGRRLTDDPAFAPIAARVVLPALQAWPTRCTAEQRPTLMQVHDAAWAYVLPADMDLLAQERLRLRSLDVVQRTHWQLVQALSTKSPAALQRLLATARQSGAGHDALLNWVAMPGMRTQLDDVDQFPLDRQSALWMALAEPIMPARWPRDAVTGWLHALASNPNPGATVALQGWLGNASLQAWHATVRALLYQQQAISRDARHTLPLIQDVATTLQRGSPANAADLAAIVLDNLKQLNKDVLGADTPLWQDYWRTVVVRDKPQQVPKVENECRDRIKQYLEPRLNALHVGIGKEAAKVDDSRCDLQISHWTKRGGELRVPVEIKRAFHPDLWTAIKDQLIDRYALDPASSGHGIYLVLWFGADKAWLKPHPQRLPIRNAQDLQRALTDTVPDALRHHIRVKVLDVSVHIKGSRR